MHLKRQLDIRILQEDGGTGRPWLTVVIDDYSRAVAGYDKIAERLGGKLHEIHQQSGSVTMMWYDVGPEVAEGKIRDLHLFGQMTTTVN